MAEVKLEDTPKKVRDIYGKAFVAFERGNFDYAQVLFTQVLELEPGLLMARKFMRAASLKQYKDDPVSKAVNSLLGIGTMMKLKGALKKDPIKALQIGEKLLRVDPLNHSFLETFSEAAVAAEMPEVAIHSLEIASEHRPEDVKLLNLLGKIYTNAGFTSKARVCYETVARLRPNDQTALQAMKNASALDTMNKGRWETDKDYRDMLKDTEEAERLEQSARAQKSTSDIDVLIEEQLRKIQGEPENVNFRRTLADLYAEAERFDEALEELEKTNEITGEADPQIEAAKSKIKLKIYDYNIRVLKESGQVDELAQMEKERAVFIMDDTENKVRKYPNDLGFKFDYGKLLYEEDRINEAIEQFQRARRNPARRIEALYYMGRCFYAKGQFDIAAEQISTALADLPVMTEMKKALYYELGLIYEAMNQMDKALENYKEIYSVDIRYKDIAQKIEAGYQGKPTD